MMCVFASARMFGYPAARGCMLAYYVEWHLREALAPILFDDHRRDAAAAERS